MYGENLRALLRCVHEAVARGDESESDAGNRTRGGDEARVGLEAGGAALHLAAGVGGAAPHVVVCRERADYCFADADVLD